MLLGAAVSGLRLPAPRRRHAAPARTGHRVRGRRAPLVAGGHRPRDPDPRQRRPGVVSAEGRLTTCSWDIGGPAPEGFWIFQSGQRLLNTVLFVPAGALLVLAAARWRTGWWTVPVGLVLLAAYSAGIEKTQLELARIDRACDVTDVVDNVTGAVLGVLLGLVLALVFRPWRRRRAPAPLGCAHDQSAAASRTCPSIPPYVAGKPPSRATRADDVQALLEREPLPAAARRPRGGAGRGGADEPLPGHGRLGAVRRAGRPARRAHRGPLRWRPARSR